MNLMHAASLTCTVALFVSDRCRAADAIADKLEKAKSDYAAKEKSLHDDVLRRLTAAEEKATKLGDKPLVDRLAGERKSFEKEKAFPRSLKAVDLRTKLENARLAMVAAYKRAISDYTKERKKDEAEKTQKDLLLFEANVQSTDAAAEAFVAGSAWNGTVDGKRSGGTGHHFDVRFTVLERTGSNFKARLEILGRGDAHHIKEVTGVVERGKIAWLAKDVKVIQGTEGGDIAGKISGEKITLSSQGIAVAGQFKGQTVTNNYKLTLQK